VILFGDEYIWVHWLRSQCFALYLVCSCKMLSAGCHLSCTIFRTIFLYKHPVQTQLDIRTAIYECSQKFIASEKSLRYLFSSTARRPFNQLFGQLIDSVPAARLQAKYTMLSTRHFHIVCMHVMRFVVPTNQFVSYHLV
jgi:hypothetical protein